MNNDPICEAPTHKDIVRRLWSTFPPPTDGRQIVALGRIIYEDGACTCVDPFTALIRWTENPGESKGWHYVADGLSLARTLEDDVRIDYWMEDPR